SILGGAPRKLIDNGQLPAISPNGSQIAFVKGPKHAEEIWLMAGNGEKPRPLVSARPNSTLRVPPRPPPGTEIAYVLSDYTPLWRANTSAVSFNLRTSREETIFSSGGRQVEEGRELELGPALIWTTDNHLVYSVFEPAPNQDDSNVWSVPLDARG